MKIEAMTPTNQNLIGPVKSLAGCCEPDVELRDSDNPVVEITRAVSEYAQLPDEMGTTSTCESAEPEQGAVDTDSGVLIPEPQESGIEISNFEIGLFKGGKVDWMNYLDSDELFRRFQTEAKDGVDKKYGGYQESLLCLLQHCYGYFYALKTDIERYEKDIKKINYSISTMNRTSNSGNSLESKVVKLAWKGTKIDRRRISTYAKLLHYAWVEGEFESGITDAKGRILPKEFASQVRLYGGINKFERESRSKLDKEGALIKEGYKNIRDKKIDLARDAINEERFFYDNNELKLTPIKFAPSNPDHYRNVRDGALVVLPAKWNKSDETMEVCVAFFEEQNNGVVDKVLLEMFNGMKKEAKQLKGV